MKIIIIGFVTLITGKCFAQDSTSFEKLLSQFTEAYYYSAKQKPNNVYVDNLVTASGVLSLYNEDFKNAKKIFKLRFPLKDDKWLVEKVSDSIVHVFINTALWKGRENELDRYGNTLSLFLEKSCQCYSEQINNKAYLTLNEAVSKCNQVIVTDTLFISMLNQSMSNLALNEKIELQKIVPTYIYQHCKIVNDTINSFISDNVYGNYYSFLQDLCFNADKILIHYFLNKNKDSLKTLFPNYFKFEANIKKAVPVYKIAFNGSVDFGREEKEKRTLTKTFIENHKIIGRVIYSIIIQNDEIKMLNYVYIPPSKISVADKKKILKDRESIPPIESINGIKIKN